MYRRWKLQTIGLLGIWLICPQVHLLYAQQGSKVNPDPMAGAEVQRGKAQFEQTCAMCHGSEAKGSGEAPNLIESSVVRHDENGNLIGAVIRDGRPTKGMPSFTFLAPEQVSDIVAFLHASITLADNRSAGSKRGYVAERFLTGNVEAGRQYFNGEGKCATCHSVSGDLKGIASKKSPLELESRILYPSTDTQTATVTLPSGRTFKGTVVHLDPFFLAIMDAGGNYHSWPLGNGVKVEVADPLHEHQVLLDKYKDKDIHDLFAYLETLK
jgi:cytochrome c oxidase cbb3-type subunit III